ERIRSGKLTLLSELAAILLQSRDHISSLVENAVNDTENSEEVIVTGKKLKSQLINYLDEEKKAKLIVEESAMPVETSKSEGMRTWTVNAIFSSEVLENGMDPLSFLRYLSKFGNLDDVCIDMDRIPAAADFNPEKCYISYSLQLSSESATKQDIESTFDFVKDDCELLVKEVEQTEQTIENPVENVPEEDFSLGKILRDGQLVSPEQLNEVLNEQENLRKELGADSAPKLGEMLVSKNLITPEVVEAALNKQSSARSQATKAARQLRVDADKLDSFINLVGELVIAGATTNLLSQHLADAQLSESVGNMLHLVEEIRDSALKLRMVQIGDTFNRFQRVVRDV
ncbi:MAG: chemotaxis protein CheA, partial [Gammaproteobacteria bacterium]|nr:chemotaxis protein CheA [Gammaproteobacteria bacterium]